MPDYKQGKIYTIRCKKDDTLIYVGSTTYSLSQRLRGHKSDSVIYPNRFLYKSIDNKWEDWYIELYELYPCKSKMELEEREGEVIKNIGTLNKRIEGGGPQRQKEYQKKCREEYLLKKAEKMKQIELYYIENGERIRQYFLNKYNRLPLN